VETRAHTPIRRFSRSFWVGVCAALLCAELGLRLIQTPFPYWQRPSPALDSPDAPAIELRTYQEGISRAHLTAGGARLTGNPFLPGAPVAVLVGDSFVAGWQVADAQTAGSVAERRLRAAGLPVNVRQFGFADGNPAEMALAAPEIRRRWHPRWTFVVLRDVNFLPGSLRNARAEIVNGPQGTAARAVEEPPRMAALKRWLTPLLTRSALLYTLFFRAKIEVVDRLRGRLELPEVPADPAAIGPSVEATLSVLRDTYGPDAVFLYHVKVPVTGEAPNPAGERALLAACRKLDLRCRSVRPAFEALRGRAIPRGFNVSAPNMGHWNAAGHEAVAGILVEEVLRNPELPEGVR
jgi:hypothetical protein